MPDYEFTMPDGVKIIITADTDPTPQVVEAVTKQYYAQKPKVGLGEVRSAERRPPVAPPSQAQIQDYRKWFKDEASGSVPYRVFQEYLLSKDRKNFKFPSGFSEVGKAAIKAEAASRVAAQREAERSSRRRMGELAGTAGVDTLSEKAGAGELLLGQLSPAASRRMTAAVTGQQASEALPLGLYPQGKLTPARGFVGTMQRAAGEMLTPEGLAMLAAAPVAGPLIEAYPILGLAAAGASALTGGVAAVQSARSGDYGKALAEAILGGVGAVGTGALARKAAAGRTAALPAEIRNLLALESRPIPMPTRPAPRVPEALPAGPERMGLPIGPYDAERLAGLGLPALPAPPTAIPMPIGPTEAARQARIASATARAGEVNVIPPSGEAPIQLGGPTNAPLLTQAEVAARRAAGFASPPPLQTARVRGLERAYYEIGAGPEVFANETHREATTRLRALLDEAAPYMRRGEQIPKDISSRIDALNQAAMRAASGDEIGARAMLGQTAATRGAAAKPTPAFKGTPQQAQSRLDQISAQIAATRRLAESGNVSAVEKTRLSRVIKKLDKEAQGINDFLSSQTGVPTAPTPIPQPVRGSRKKKPSELTPEEVSAGVEAPVAAPPMAATEAPVVASAAAEPTVTTPISGPYSMVPKQPIEEILPTPENIVPPSAAKPPVAPAPSEPVIPPTPTPSYSVASKGRTTRQPLTPEQQTLADDLAREVANIAGFERWNQINRRSTIEREAAQVGVPGAVPPRGVNQPGLRAFKDDVDRVVSDPEYRASVLAEIEDFNPNNPNDIANMTTARQTAASYRRRELAEQLKGMDQVDTPEGRAALSAYQRLAALVTKVGSRKGWDLAMQNLFAGPLDFRKADAVDRALDLATTALRTAGASDAQISRVAQMARDIAVKGQGRFAEIASRIDQEAAASEAARAGTVPARRTTMKRQAKTASEEPLLPEGVQLIKDGIKDLEQFKKAIIKKLGGQIPDDRIEALFRDALRKYALDSSEIDAIKTEFLDAVNKETWNSYSTGQKAMVGLRNIQNIHRALVLNLDMGVYGIQLGMAQATRPALGFVSPKQASQATIRKNLLTRIFGGPPEKGAGYIPASLRVLKAKTPDEVAARVAEVDSELNAVQKIQYPDIDNPYEQAGLMGFAPQEVNTGLLNESMLGRNIVSQILGPLGGLYSKFDDANQAALRYGRAAIFEQLMQPFMKYEGEDKLAAMRAVAHFTNTLTGGARYGDSESLIRGLSAAFISPRYQLSALEMGSGVAPFVRSVAAAKQGIGPDGTKYKLAPGMVKDIAKMVGSEYARIYAMMGTAKLLLAPLGIDVGMDPRDRNTFGKAIVPVGEGMEETIDLTGRRGEAMALIMEVALKMRPQELSKTGWIPVDAGTQVWNYSKGKMTIVPQMVFSRGTFTPDKLAEGPGLGSMFGGQYSLPGGKTWTPSDLQSTFINLGDVLIPFPIVLKQMAQLGKTGMMLNSGDINADREQFNALMALSGTNLAAGFFGAPVSLRPSVKARVPMSLIAKKAGSALTPLQREQVRLKAMTQSGK